MILECDVCGEETKVPAREAYARDRKHPRLYQVCSPACAMQFLKQHDNGCNVFRCQYPLLRGDDRVLPDGSSHFSELLGQDFRSLFEVLVAEWFYTNGRETIQEPVTFRIDGRWGPIHYTPDLYDPKSRVFIEIKGVWASGQRQKIVKCLDQYPDMRLLFLHWSLNTQFMEERNGRSRPSCKTATR